MPHPGDLVPDPEITFKPSKRTTENGIAHDPVAWTPGPSTVTPALYPRWFVVRIPDTETQRPSSAVSKGSSGVGRETPARDG